LVSKSPPSNAVARRRIDKLLKMANLPASLTTPQVSFGSVEIRHYERVIGGGGHYETLASLGIGWRFSDSETYTISPRSLSDGEDESFFRRRQPAAASWLFGVDDRVEHLIEYGFTMQEIWKAEKEMQNILERETCVARERIIPSRPKQRTQKNRGRTPDWFFKRIRNLRGKLSVS
jgi:hypothetical protein